MLWMLQVWKIFVVMFLVGICGIGGGGVLLLVVGMSGVCFRFLCSVGFLFCLLVLVMWCCGSCILFLLSSSRQVVVSNSSVIILFGIGFRFIGFGFIFGMVVVRWNLFVLIGCVNVLVLFVILLVFCLIMLKVFWCSVRQLVDGICMVLKVLVRCSSGWCMYIIVGVCWFSVILLVRFSCWLLVLCIMCSMVLLLLLVRVVLSSVRCEQLKVFGLVQVVFRLVFSICIFFMFGQFLWMVMVLVLVLLLVRVVFMCLFLSIFCSCVVCEVSVVCRFCIMVLCDIFSVWFIEVCCYCCILLQLNQIVSSISVLVSNGVECLIVNGDCFFVFVLFMDVFFCQCILVWLNLFVFLVLLLKVFIICRFMCVIGSIISCVM